MVSIVPGGRPVSADPGSGEMLYLPLVNKSTQPAAAVRTVNTPFFAAEPAMNRSHEMAIFWFGAVQHPQNYSDVRIGYTPSALTVHVSVIDRRLWYDETPDPGSFSAWDSSSLYLNLDGPSGAQPGARSFRLDSMMNWWEPRANFQAAYRCNGQGWSPEALVFTTTSGWRGNVPLDNQDDHGWTMTYSIPFTSLGLSGPPPEGTVWGLGVTVYDRDDSGGTTIAPIKWPEGFTSNSPAAWGALLFGLPTYQQPQATQPVPVTIRHGYEGAVVRDGEVGGHTTCGGSLDYWSAWGNTSYPGSYQINIQNQADVSDFPCFSKFYITFPLDQIPPGKVILDASLTMHLFGNSGQGSAPEPSLIQVMTVKEDWNEASLTWNNAPLAYENVSRQWVNPTQSYPGLPGIPYTWDLAGAVANAYSRGEPLRLALYSGDWAIHSGKYFWSSDVDAGNVVGRPTLNITWGTP